MIKIIHPVTAQTATVTKGAYAQVYAPIGWVLAETPVRVEAPVPVTVPKPVKEPAPKKEPKPKKTKAQVIDELLAEE